MSVLIGELLIIRLIYSDAIACCLDSLMRDGVLSKFIEDEEELSAE